MFLKNKFTKWYFAIIDKAKREKRKKFKRDSPNFVYYEKHHIIPKCMGGEETLLLTAKEHYICHLLLPYMTEGTNRIKMINALVKMRYNKSKGQDRYTARSYSLVRKLIAEKNSSLFRGSKKSLETREKISKSRLGMKFSEEHRKKIGLGSLGRIPWNRGRKLVYSEKTLENWSKIRKGKNLGNKGGSDFHWITDDFIEKFVKKTEAIPDNFRHGRLKNARTKESPAQGKT